MGQLIFAIVWTGIMIFIVAFGGLSGTAPLERALFMLLPIFGVALIWHSWKRLRRWRSLRTETVGGVSVYVWIETDGSECRSTRDPRPDWEDDDGDGDGDGGGGD